MNLTVQSKFSIKSETNWRYSKISNQEKIQIQTRKAHIWIYPIYYLNIFPNNHTIAGIMNC